MILFLIAVMTISFFVIYFNCPKHERWTIILIGGSLALLLAIALKA